VAGRELHRSAGRRANSKHAFVVLTSSGRTNRAEVVVLVLIVTSALMVFVDLSVS
jgi:hypothetical protein